jgi:hypothetical protein
MSAAKVLRALEEGLESEAGREVRQGSDKVWSLQELKAIKSQARNYQAEEALPRIRSIVSDFQTKAAHGANSDQADFISEAELRKLLFELNPAARLLSADSHIVRFKAPRLARVPRIPSGYGFKGGVARLALQTVLGRVTGNELARDFDLVRFGRIPSRMDRQVAERLMESDFRHGAGVELVESLDRYFSTRDLSVNEAILISGQVICTQQALVDTIHGKIRPTQHVKRSDGTLEPLVAMKTLRFQAEALAKGRNSAIVGLTRPLECVPFALAVHLERALDSGNSVAEIFLQQCMAWEALPKEIINLDQLKTFLDRELSAGMRFSRPAPAEAYVARQTGRKVKL